MARFLFFEGPVGMTEPLYSIPHFASYVLPFGLEQVVVLSPPSQSAAVLVGQGGADDDGPSAELFETAVDIGGGEDTAGEEPEAAPAIDEAIIEDIAEDASGEDVEAGLLEAPFGADEVNKMPLVGEEVTALELASPLVLLLAIVGNMLADVSEAPVSKTGLDDVVDDDGDRPAVPLGELLAPCTVLLDPTKDVLD